MRLRNSELPILYKFLFSYLLLLIIPIIMGGIIYTKTVSMVEKDIENTNIAILQQSMNIVDRHLQEIDNIVKRLALNPKIISFINMKPLQEGSSELYKVIDALEDISGYRTANSLIKEIFIYSKRNDIIMSTTTAQTRMSLVYGKYFKYKDYSYEQWKEQIISPFHRNVFLPSSKVTLNGSVHSVVLNLQSIPFDSPQNNRGDILALIDADQINQLLNRVIVNNNSFFYIVDNSNNLITSSTQTVNLSQIDQIQEYNDLGMTSCKINGIDMVISYVISPYNGWKYVTVIPSSYIMAKVNYIARIIILTTVLGLVLGLIFSFVLSYKNSKPIKDISKMLEESVIQETKVKNQYVFMKGSISKLISNNKELQNQVKHNTPIIKAALFRRLIKGNFSDSEEMNTNLCYLGLKVEEGSFAVLILRINGYGNNINKNILKELDVTRIIITNLIYEKLGDNIVSCELDELRIAILLSYTADEKESRNKVEQFTKEIFEQMLIKYNIGLSFSIGNFRTDMLDIGYSFLEAQQAMEYTLFEGNKRLIWYADIPRQTSIYLYPVDIETRLMALVKSGDFDEAVKILNNIYQENFFKRKLPSFMLKQLIYQMRGTVIRLSESIPGFCCSEEEFLELVGAESIEDVYSSICNVYKEMCNCINNQKLSSDEKLKNDILDYVGTQFVREDLTLYMIAIKFNMTETYLYNYFKDRIGMSYASYIEKIRIEKASQLLMETEWPVQEIAEKVGYSNVHSFRRAFKRCKGFIPSEMRSLY